MVECDQCGARRPRTGPCPECGAPPPGTFNSMRQWKDQARTGEGPAVGRRTSGANWRANDRGRSGGDWDRGGWDEEDDYDAPPARSGGRNRRRGGPDYEEVDLDRALVPMQNDMLPMDPSIGAGGAGVPALPGMPQTDEEERALGIRRPVYIPATGEKRKRKLGTWRVVSGVLSIMLVCMASCALAGLLGKDRLAWFQGPSSRTPTPLAFSTAQVPVTPIATQGPAASHIQNVVTATGVDGLINPTGLTSHFVKDSTVFLVMGVRGFPKSETHTISVRWFLQGQDLEIPCTFGQTCQKVNGDSQVDFSLGFPQPGLGMAKVYVDKPDKDKGDDPKDPALAATIYFAVEMPTPVPTPKTGTPSGTPSGSPAGSPTAPPKAYAPASDARPARAGV